SFISRAICEYLQHQLAISLNRERNLADENRRLLQNEINILRLQSQPDLSAPSDNQEISPFIRVSSGNIFYFNRVNGILQNNGITISGTQKRYSSYQEALKAANQNGNSLPRSVSFNQEGEWSIEKIFEQEPGNKNIPMHLMQKNITFNIE
ncbi:14441_t:CDS:2, partial [Gigaspora margarita]